MKIVVSAMGYDLESPFSPVFGRCQAFVFVDTETMAFQSIPNPAASAGGGAGVQAAQEVVDRGAQAVISGAVGPNAYQVLASAGVAVCVFEGGTVRQAVEAYRAGRLSSVGEPTGPAHGGAGMMRGMGAARGMGGRGASMGRGMARQGGGRPGGPYSPLQTPPRAAEPTARPSQGGEDVADLRAEVAELRDRLEKLSDRIEGQSGK
jgi:predicted Fe-Mo cluster-binding NifX family protein